MVHSLVTQANRKFEADIVKNKGNGLIVLLHGPPGTGKTLTAESVAEVAEKPLLQIACGDMGTSPSEVEKSMNSILRLGQRWDCVVLLDEADTFLEQRTSQDIERSALVSVFLRILEYYNGILILTSNRVGSFDEAFKSRIHLSVHYKAPSRLERRKIWKNLLNRLEDLEESPDSPIANLTEDIDVVDIEMHIDDLARYAMNGRQIRNVVSTARQLARYREERMSSEHLQHAIDASEQFNKYISELHDGVSDDQMARESGIR